MEVSLSEARIMALNSYEEGNSEEADRICCSIIGRFPKDEIANYILGLIAFDYKSYSMSLTYLRNASRANPNNALILDAIDKSICAMKEEAAKGVFVIGDSHTWLYKHIVGVVVRWVGPITMFRIGRDGTNFLDYRHYGAGPGAAVATSFGEVDVRNHFSRHAGNDARSVREMADRLAGAYLSVLAKASELSGIKRQIVLSLPPPVRDGINLDQFRAGDLTRRVSATLALNDGLRFGCGLLGFGYLDQYGPFADGDGSLDARFTDDGNHLKADVVPTLAQALSSLL